MVNIGEMREVIVYWIGMKMFFLFWFEIMVEIMKYEDYNDRWRSRLDFLWKKLIYYGEVVVIIKWLKFIG